MLPVAQSILRNLPGLIPLFDESPTTTPPASPTVVVEPTATLVPVEPLPVVTPSLWAPGQWLRTSGWDASFHMPFAVLFALIAVAALLIYTLLFQRRFKHHKLHAHLSERVSIILTVFAVVGFLLLGSARIKLPLLSWPLWLIASMVALIAFAIYAVYYYTTAYPPALATYERELEKERYLPRRKTKGPAYTPPMKKKDKEKQKEKQKQKQKRK
jgi:hypothetical protein